MRKMRKVTKAQIFVHKNTKEDVLEWILKKLLNKIEDENIRWQLECLNGNFLDLKSSL